MYLYLVTNLINEKQYVGITSKPVRVRWSQHIWSSNNGSSHALHRALAKYGRDNFSIDVLAVAEDFDSLKAMEVAEIAKRGTYGHGYNSTTGGDGVTGFSHSDEARAKMSKAHAGKTLTPEHVAILVAANTGRKMPPEHSERLRSRVISPEERAARSERAKGNQWSKGVKRTPEQCAAIGERSRGRKATDETKRKIREARAMQAPTFGMKGKSHSDETKAKMSAAKLGKKKSPETIERMRIAARKRVEAKRNGNSDT